MNTLKPWLSFFKGAVGNQKKVFFACVLISILSTVVGTLTILITGKIINLVQQFSINRTQEKVINLLLILIGIYMIKVIINLINSNAKLVSNYKLKKYSSKVYITLINKMDYLNMSKSEYKKSLDIINRELIDNKCIDDFMMLFTYLFSSFLSIFIIGRYTVDFNIFLLLLLILIFLLSLISGIFSSKLYINKRNKIINDIRMEYYLSSVFDSINISREFFFFPFQNKLFNKWESIYKSNNNILIREKNIGELIKIISNVIVLCLVFFYLFITLRKMDDSLFGTFFIILLSILNISNNIMNLGMICNRFYISSKNLSEIETLERTFEKTKCSINKEINNLITFKNVSFKYADKLVLNNINLVIRKGEKIGIVGVNGSGKSTFIKLLCGLYKPLEGEVSVFGQNYHDNLLSKKDIDISVVMQDFSIYSGYTVEENIILDKPKTKYENYKNLENIELILEKKDLLVGERFGGTNLSKGQWQLVSILRAVNADKEVLILDEPTSSLDPIVEKKVYEELIEKNKNKTIFIVAHRLASVKNVDKIYYIENGEIVEYGSHKELISIENGKYKKLYDEQAKWYKEKI